MSLGSHFEDVEIAVAAAGLDADGVDRVLVGLLRSLAKKMDAADGEPSDRLLASYLSASKDLMRTVAARAKVAEAAARAAARTAPPATAAPSSPDPTQPPQLRAVEVSPLDQLRHKEAKLDPKRSGKSAAR